MREAAARLAARGAGSVPGRLRVRRHNPDPDSPNAGMQRGDVKYRFVIDMETIRA